MSKHIFALRAVARAASSRKFVSRLLVAATLGTSAFGAAVPAAAQEFPTRPITLIVPFVAGGGIDVGSRLLAARMSELLGQAVVVDNVGGGGGMIGGRRVVDARPDGYTILAGNVGTHAYTQVLYKRPLYDVLKDFEPLMMATDAARVLVVRKDLPVNNLQEFVTYVKANQAKMQFGSAGVGSATHLPCVLLNQVMGVDVLHLPFRGSGLVMNELLGGRVDYMCDSIQTAAAQIKGGTVKAIAIMAEKRSPVIPDVPTTGEQGMAGVEASAWNAYFLPKGTPPAIIAKLNKAMSDALDTPVIRTRLEDLGADVVPVEKRTPEYLAKLLPAEIERWAKPIRAAGISID
jgi:tripartite-type tricarboxylate transporter receptor subunit TctC